MEIGVVVWYDSFVVVLRKPSSSNVVIKIEDPPCPFLIPPIGATATHELVDTKVFWAY